MKKLFKGILYYSPYIPYIGMILMMVHAALPDTKEEDSIAFTEEHSESTFALQLISLIVVLIYVVLSLIILTKQYNG